jgi:hypothetical protein
VAALVLIICFGGILAELLILLSGGGGRAKSERLSPGWEYALPLIPWGLLIVLATVQGRIGRSVGLRVRWRAQSFLAEPYVLEALPDGLVLTQPRSRCEYRWESFQGFKETPNLFLLYQSPYSFYMVPKRAFAGGGQIEQFRGLLTRVPEGQFLPRDPVAFPVVPFANVAGGNRAPPAPDAPTI